MLGFGTIARKVFGSTNDRKVKAAQKTVDAVAALEPEYEALSDEQLAAKTVEFRERVAGGGRPRVRPGAPAAGGAARGPGARRAPARCRAPFPATGRPVNPLAPAIAEGAA